MIQIEPHVDKNQGWVVKLYFKFHKAEINQLHSSVVKTQLIKLIEMVTNYPD